MSSIWGLHWAWCHSAQQRLTSRAFWRHQLLQLLTCVDFCQLGWAAPTCANLAPSPQAEWVWLTFSQTNRTAPHLLPCYSHFWTFMTAKNLFYSFSRLQRKWNSIYMFNWSIPASEVCSVYSASKVKYRLTERKQIDQLDYLHFPYSLLFFFTSVY